MLAEYFLNVACILALFLGLMLGSHTETMFVAVVEVVNFLQFLDCYPKLMGKYYQPSLSH